MGLMSERECNEKTNGCKFPSFSVFVDYQMGILLPRLFIFVGNPIMKSQLFTEFNYSNTPLYRPTSYTVNVGGIDYLAVVSMDYTNE